MAGVDQYEIIKQQDKRRDDDSQTNLFRVSVICIIEAEGLPY